MKKILFPTDFSPASNNAFVYALQMAKNMDAEIVTVHIYEMPVVDYIDVPSYLMEVYDTVELANFENYRGQIPILRRIAEENGCSDVPISNVLMDGDLVSTILQMVKTDAIDYVVMGTKGASGAKETFLGTSTASVMMRTDAYVLAVPDESRYRPIRKITFTTNFDPGDLVALRKLCVFAAAFDAAIDCLFVKTRHAEVKEVVIADWELQFRDKDVTFHVVESEEVESSILEFLENNDTDVLALLNHRRGFFERMFRDSLTKKLAFHSSIPVLALHESQ